MSISENIQKINDEILDIKTKNGLKNEVKLMAVSKFHPAQDVLDAIKAGSLLFGENRVQEAIQKFPQILEENPNVCLHMIGQLQTNKVRHAVQIASCIQSVDRIELLYEIEKQASKLNKSIQVLFEYHTAEDSKSGFENKEEVIKALDLCANNTFPHIIPNGFMTMAPFCNDEKLIRKSFTTLRNLKDELQSDYKMFNLSELSMGMSGDYKIAVEEGSTLVRIGTAIFGERNYNK